MVPSAGLGTGAPRAGSWQAVCCAASHCCLPLLTCRSPPGSEIPFGVAGGQLVAQHGSPVSALPAGRVLARARFPLAGMCQHPWELGGITRLAGAEALGRDSLSVPSLPGVCGANTTEATASSACPWPWVDGITGVRGTVPAGRLEHPVGLSSPEGPWLCWGREGLSPEIRLCWDHTCCTHLPPPRSRGHEVPAGPWSANVFAGGIGFGLPWLSPAPWQPCVGLFLVTAWQPEVI